MGLDKEVSCAEEGELIIILLKALCQYISSNWLLYLTPDAVKCVIA